MFYKNQAEFLFQKKYIYSPFLFFFFCHCDITHSWNALNYRKIMTVLNNGSKCIAHKNTNCTRINVWKQTIVNNQMQNSSPKVLNATDLYKSTQVVWEEKQPTTKNKQTVEDTSALCRVWRWKSMILLSVTGGIPQTATSFYTTSSESFLIHIIFFVDF